MTALSKAVNSGCGRVAAASAPMAALCCHESSISVPSRHAWRGSAAFANFALPRCCHSQRCAVTGSSRLVKTRRGSAKTSGEVLAFPRNCLTALIKAGSRGYGRIACCIGANGGVVLPRKQHRCAELPCVERGLRRLQTSLCHSQRCAVTGSSRLVKTRRGSASTSGEVLAVPGNCLTALSRAVTRGCGRVARSIGADGGTVLPWKQHRCVELPCVERGLRRLQTSLCHSQRCAVTGSSRLVKTRRGSASTSGEVLAVPGNCLIALSRAVTRGCGRVARSVDANGGTVLPWKQPSCAESSCAEKGLRRLQTSLCHSAAVHSAALSQEAVYLRKIAGEVLAHPGKCLRFRGTA